MSLLADYNLPFAAALVLMVLLAILQVSGIGHLFGDADADVDGHSGVGHFGGLPDLLGVGRVPLMIWLALFLFVFAAIGVSLQGFAESLTGTPLYRWLAAVIAAGAALPVTGAVVRPLAYILPSDETTAVGLDSLVGRRGRIVTGRAREGSPARARVEDHFGQPHHVMVVPQDAGAEIAEGDHVLIVRREGELFFGVGLDDRILAPI